MDSKNGDTLSPLQERELDAALRVDVKGAILLDKPGAR
jgi:hypothetical protein